MSFALACFTSEGLVLTSRLSQLPQPPFPLLFLLLHRHYHLLLLCCFENAGGFKRRGG